MPVSVNVMCGCMGRTYLYHPDSVVSRIEEGEEKQDDLKTIAEQEENQHTEN